MWKMVATHKAKINKKNGKKRSEQSSAAMCVSMCLSVCVCVCGDNPLLWHIKWNCALNSWLTISQLWRPAWTVRAAASLHALCWPIAILHDCAADSAARPLTAAHPAMLPSLSCYLPLVRLCVCVSTHISDHCIYLLRIAITVCFFALLLTAVCLCACAYAVLISCVACTFQHICWA